MSEDERREPVSKRSKRFSRGERWFLYLVGIFALFYVYMMIGGMITKPQKTIATMTLIARQMALYAETQMSPPDTLAQLQKKMHDDPYVDAWGREFLYVRNGNGSVTLRSYGRDGKPGGEGDDADIEQAFVIGNAGQSP